MFFDVLFSIYAPTVLIIAFLISVFAVGFQYHMGKTAKPKTMKRLPRLFLLLAFIISMHFFIGHMMVLRLDWVIIIFLLPYTTPIILYILHDEQWKRRKDL